MSKKVYWTTKDGKEVDVDEMTIEHLRNTLKMLIRKRYEDRGSGCYDYRVVTTSDHYDYRDDIVFDPFWDLG